MDVNRHVERLGALVDRPEALIVMEDAVGQAVDHRTLETELGHGAFELVGRGARIGSRQGRKGGEAVGMRAHRLVEPVVDAVRERHAPRRVDRLQSRDRMRQYLKVDAAFVHLPEAKGAEIGQPFLEAACATGGAEAGTAGEPPQLGILVVLFERDDVGLRFCHCCPPLLISGSLASS
jgi:hypothetical protein